MRYNTNIKQRVDEISKVIKGSDSARGKEKTSLLDLISAFTQDVNKLTDDKLQPQLALEGKLYVDLSAQLNVIRLLRSRLRKDVLPTVIMAIEGNATDSAKMLEGGAASPAVSSTRAASSSVLSIPAALPAVSSTAPVSATRPASSTRPVVSFARPASATRSASSPAVSVGLATLFRRMKRLISNRLSVVSGEPTATQLVERFDQKADALFTKVCIPSVTLLCVGVYGTSALDWVTNAAMLEMAVAGPISILISLCMLKSAFVSVAERSASDAKRVWVSQDLQRHMQPVIPPWVVCLMFVALNLNLRGHSADSTDENRGQILVGLCGVFNALHIWSNIVACGTRKRIKQVYLDDDSQGCSAAV